MNRDHFSYWKGNPVVTETRMNLLKCNVSEKQVWNARVYAQDEIHNAGCQVEPPGMHTIYLPYSDDIRQTDEIQVYTSSTAPRATDDHVIRATA
ncbi:hypothetical protein AgCh_009122 [Apium graveolens]